MRDIHSDFGVVQSIAPQAVTAALNGAGVDLQNFNAALFVVDLGAIAGTTPTADIALQESDDNVTFTAIAAGNLLGGGQIAQITGANDAQVYKRGYIGTKRYVRAAVTATGGTSPSLPMSAHLVLGEPYDAPVA